jgi:putative transposase
VILAVQQGLAAEGCRVPLAKLCRWFEVPRRTLSYRPVKSAQKVRARLSEPLKPLIEESPSFGIGAGHTCWHE